MKAPLRLKYFLWLAITLGVFILIQFIAWFLWEFSEFLTGTDETFGKGMGEFLVVLGVDVFCLPFLLVFLWYLSRRMLYPLRSISETATRISRGELKERIGVEQQDDELGVLAATIDEAFDG